MHSRRIRSSPRTTGRAVSPAADRTRAIALLEIATRTAAVAAARRCRTERRTRAQGRAGQAGRIHAAGGNLLLSIFKKPVFHAGCPVLTINADTPRTKHQPSQSRRHLAAVICIFQFPLRNTEGVVGLRTAEVHRRARQSDSPSPICAPVCVSSPLSVCVCMRVCCAAVVCAFARIQRRKFRCHGQPLPRTRGRGRARAYTHRPTRRCEARRRDVLVHSRAHTHTHVYRRRCVWGMYHQLETLLVPLCLYYLRPYYKSHFAGHSSLSIVPAHFNFRPRCKFHLCVVSDTSRSLARRDDDQFVYYDG